MVIARGDAKAVRGNVTVTADRLIAWSRARETDPTASQPAATGDPTPTQPTASQPAATGDPTPTQPAATNLTGDTKTQGNEVYRMRAEGNVHIYTETDQAWGDQATYDLDQAGSWS